MSWQPACCPACTMRLFKRHKCRRASGPCCTAWTHSSCVCCSRLISITTLTNFLLLCREHELAASLLSSLYHEIIQSAQMQKGFRNLLHSVEDLKLDVPSAEEDVALFLARAVIDDVLPPSFLQKVPCGEDCLADNGQCLSERVWCAFLSRH